MGNNPDTKRPRLNRVGALVNTLLTYGDANKVEPGKRPLSAMSRTIVLDPEGKPLLSLGAAGGPTIISQTVLNSIYRLNHARR